MIIEFIDYLSRFVRTDLNIFPDNFSPANFLHILSAFIRFSLLSVACCCVIRGKFHFFIENYVCSLVLSLCLSLSHMHSLFSSFWFRLLSIHCYRHFPSISPPVTVHIWICDCEVWLHCKTYTRIENRKQVQSFCETNSKTKRNYNQQPIDWKLQWKWCSNAHLQINQGIRIWWLWRL